EGAPGMPLFLGALGPQMLRLAGGRYDGAALNWCSIEQVAWSREQVVAGARAVKRDAREVRIHEYVRVCIDDDVAAARAAFAKMVLTYALARPGADKTKGYRAPTSRGWASVTSSTTSSAGATAARPRTSSPRVFPMSSYA